VVNFYEVFHISTKKKAVDKFIIYPQHKKKVLLIIIVKERKYAFCGLIFIAKIVPFYSHNVANG
jgi:hypothetical protein